MNLEVRGLVMEYPGVRALDHVSIQFRAGEVHAIVGENGAGKSTLLKILCGIHQPNQGDVMIDGQPVTLEGVRHSEELGIGMIHQELNLIDNLNVSENIFLGRERKSRFWLDQTSMSQEASDVLGRLRSTIGPTRLVAELPLAEKQLVEIAKAVQRGARVVVMDEPTAVLSEHEVMNLLELVRSLASSGTTIIYVSHRLDEVLKISDRITVLRDGKFVTTLENNSITSSELANLMVGREIGDLYSEKPPISADVVLEVKNLEPDGCSGPSSLNVRRGEVLGLGGLVGSGRTELCEAIAGLRGVSSGNISVNSESGRTRAIAYVSEDRKSTGLHVELSVLENVTMANLSHYCSPVVNEVRRESSVREWIDVLKIKVNSSGDIVKTLSGGNQQKVSLAKWLETKPSVLILDEPTRGVDVGAKVEIYKLIAKLASEGLACIVVSSEMNELIGLCHRVLVLRERKIVGELVGDEITEEKLVHLAAGVSAA